MSKINLKKKILPVIIVLVSIRVFAFEMVVQGRIDEMYDSNINASSTEPESDWTTNLMAGLAINSELRELDISLAGNIYQRLSFGHRENNMSYQDLLFSLNKSFSENVVFRMADSFENYPQSRSFGSLFGRSDAATGYTNNTFSTGLSVYVTKQIFIEGSYSNGILNNDSSLMVDSLYHNPGGDIGYCYDTANIFKVGYFYTLMKYDNGTQSRGDRGFIEYDRDFTKQMRLALQTGYDYITNNQGQALSTRWMASLIDDVDQNNQLNISYLKESTISNVYNDTFQNWRISGSLIREVSERTRVNFTIFYGVGTYEISGVSDELAGASAALSFIVTEFINFNVGYSFTWSRNVTPGSIENEYNRNQIFAGLSGAY